MPDALQVTAAGWLFISLGHTVRHPYAYTHATAANICLLFQISRKDWQNNAKFNTLPLISNVCARAGWLQGSGFFIINGTVDA